MCERMELADTVYKVVTPSKISSNRKDYDRDEHRSKCYGGEATLSTIPKKGHFIKGKKLYAVHLISQLTGEKHAWCMAPGTSWKSVKSP